MKKLQLLPGIEPHAQICDPVTLTTAPIPLLVILAVCYWNYHIINTHIFTSIAVQVISTTERPINSITDTDLYVTLWSHSWCILLPGLMFSLTFCNSL